jgi:hypothetical protein
MPRRLNRFSQLVLMGLLAAGIVVSLVLIREGINLFSQADPANAPQNIIVTNQWNGRFGIAFETTAVDTLATLVIGTDAANVSQVVYDSQGQDFKGPLHLFNVTGLVPDKTYYYKFLINSNIYDNGGEPYTIKTLKLDLTPFENIPIGGKIDPVKTPCLVYSHVFTNSETSLPSIDSVAANGTYTINLDYMLKKDSYTLYDMSTSNLIIFVKCADGTSGGVTTPANKDPGVVTLSSTFAVKSYYNDMKDFTAVAGTITPTPNGGLTSTPTYTTIPATKAPTNAYTASPTKTNTPVPTKKPTTTDNLPHTAITDDSQPFIWGILLIILGLYIKQSLKKPI